MKKKDIFFFVVFLIIGLLITWQYFVNKDTAGIKEELIKLGYSSEVATEIASLYNADELKKILELEVNDLVLEFKKVENFEFSNLERYISYHNSDISYGDTIKLVNYNIDEKDVTGSKKLVDIIDSKYFIEKRLDRYISYYKNNPDVSNIVELVNCNRDYDYYTNIIDADLSKGDLIIANKYYSLGEFEPSSENSIEGSSIYFLADSAYNAYTKMKAAAVSDGYKFSVTSAYRTYNTQKKLYENYAAMDGYAEADRYSARPGHSDHQTGLVVDLVGSFGGMEQFGETPEFDWMMNNAHKYGFILRYPDGKENVTGYMYESWHYRYVGESTATKIKELGITFDEYYAYFIDK